MTVPSAAKKKSPKKAIIILAVVIIAAAIVAIPPVLAGGLMVPVSKIGFGEMTGSLAASGTANANVSVVTAYEYYFLVRSRGMVQTTDSSVSSSSGTVVVTIDMKLTNPANLTTDLGNTTITGGIGTRDHTVYLSIDQGVRVSGSYTLTISLWAKVTLLGAASVLFGPVPITVSFTVS